MTQIGLAISTAEGERLDARTVPGLASIDIAEIAAAVTASTDLDVTIAVDTATSTSLTYREADTQKLCFKNVLQDADVEVVLECVHRALANGGGSDEKYNVTIFKTSGAATLQG